MELQLLDITGWVMKLWEDYLEPDPGIHGIPSLVLKEYSPVCLKMSSFIKKEKLKLSTWERAAPLHVIKGPVALKNKLANPHQYCCVTTMQVPSLLATNRSRFKGKRTDHKMRDLRAWLKACWQKLGLKGEPHLRQVEIEYCIIFPVAFL